MPGPTAAPEPYERQILSGLSDLRVEVAEMRVELKAAVERLNKLECVAHSRQIAALQMGNARSQAVDATWTRIREYALKILVPLVSGGLGAWLGAHLRK